MTDEKDKTEDQDNHEKCYDSPVLKYVPYGVTSFDEMEAIEEAREASTEVSELVGMVPQLAENIMSVEDGDKLSMFDNLIVQFKNRVGKLFGGSDKEKTEVEELPKEKSDSFVMFYKDRDTDRYRWVARYSNNFRDDDNPPEIISKASHLRFDERVNKGEFPMPVLQLWHVDEWKFGEADYHTVDQTDDGVVFSIASGTVDKDKEFVADWLMTLDPDEIRVSHGMPKTSILRDQKDKTVIVEHQTTEISPLSKRRAANSLTGFILKEEEPMISEEKRKELEGKGLKSEQIDALEAANQKDTAEAKEIGLETKEADTPEVEEPTEEPANEEKEVDEPETEPQLTVAEVKEAFDNAILPLIERIDNLETEVKELTLEDEEKIAKEVADTPAASLKDMLAETVIGKEATRVDGRTKEANSGPKQEPVPDPDDNVPAIVRAIQQQNQQALQQ